MRLKTGYILFCHIILPSFIEITRGDFVNKNDLFELVQKLRSSIKGYVLFRGSPDYEISRQNVAFLP